MKVLKQLILIVVLGMVACRKQHKEVSADDLKGLSDIRSDTTFFDESGQKWEVHFNAKIMDVENSINGPVKYAFAMDNGELTYDKFGNISKIIYKDIYYNDSYKIHIDDDSVKVGQVFIASIWTKFDRCVIEIEEPKKELATGSNVEEYLFEFPCSDMGTYYFKGKIKTDSVNFAFNYSFIVN